jgi:tripartite-type tricarboxylate transporter receptor subunit TctC
MGAMTRRAFAALLGAGAAPAVIRPAAAQTAAGEWPSRPVRIIAPFAPGGSADTLGRLVARGLQDALGQSFVVENRAGAGGLIGSAAVARAQPDGHTLVISGIASHVIAPASTAGGAEFDGLRDFSHIAYLGGPPIIFVVGPRMTARSMPAILALAQGDRQVAYATPGAGTHGHLIGEMFARASRANMEAVPYRGGGNSISDLLGGTLEAAVIAITAAAEPVRSGRLHGIAVSSAARLPGFPDLPTFAELGFPELTATTWFGLAGPAGMPPAIVERLNAEVRRIMARPDMRARLDADGIVTPDMGVAEFNRFVAEETARWAPLARASLNANR